MNRGTAARRPGAAWIRTAAVADRRHWRITVSRTRPTRCRRALPPDREHTAQPDNRNQSAAARSSTGTTCPERLNPGINMAPLRRFRACSGTRKWKRRCTRIRRDERKCTPNRHWLWSEPVTRASVPSAISLLIRVHLRFHFLAPGRHTRTRSAKERQAEKHRRREPWSMPDRCADTRRLVRTAPCVAGSSARHW